MINLWQHQAFVRSGAAVARPASRLAGELALDVRLRVLSVAFLVGQLCDAVTTHVALSSGRFAEANPFFADAMATHQTLAMVLKLGLSFTVLVGALTKLGGRRRRVVLLVLACISLEAPAMNAMRILGVL